MSNKLALSFELTADPAKLKAGLAVARRDILANYADIKRGVEDASKALAAAQANAQAMARNLSQSGPPTRAMVAEFDKARAAVLDGKAAVEGKVKALQNARAAAAANAAAMAQVAAAENAAASAAARRLLLLQTGGGSGAARSVAAITPAATAAAAAVARVEGNLVGVSVAGSRLAPVAGQLSRLQAGVLAIAGAGIGVTSLGGLSRLSDGYAALDSRVKLVSTSLDDFKAAQEGVYRIALQNGQAAEANGSFYGSIARAVRNMGRDTGDALSVTEGLANSLKISRAAQQESASATLQFAQALRSGVLRGDEFNTVMEAAPRLAQALADGLRVPQDRLRQLAEEGKLTSAQIVEALLSQSDALKREADSMTLTIGQASANMSTAFQRAFGERTASNAAVLANGIDLLAKNIDTLIDVAALAGAGLMTAFGARLVTAIFAGVAAKQALIAAEREQAGAALVTAQSNVRAAQAEAARTLTTRNLTAAQLQLAAAEKAATAAAAGTAARVGAGIVGALGGPLGLVTTLLTVGVTAWSLWGTRAEAATEDAGKSLGELIKEMQDFGANMSVAEKTKQYESLAAAISKAREEEEKLRRIALQRAKDDGISTGIVTKAGVAAAVENDPDVIAKAAERKKAEKYIQDELTKINKAADEERAFLFKALIDKQKVLNGELVIDEKKSLETRMKDQRSAADAVRDAWLKSLDLVKQKQAEAAASADKVAEKSQSLRDRSNQVKLSGMSEDQRADELRRQADEARQGAVSKLTDGRSNLMSGYSRKLQGDLDGAKKSFDAAEKDLSRAYDLAEKAADSGLMDEIGDKLVDIEKERGKIAAGEATQAEAQAEAQRAKMNELSTAADELQKKLAGMEVDIQIDAAVAKLKQLYADAAAFQAMLAGGQASSPTAAPDNLTARAYGGELPGWAPHDRADNGLYRGTPGEWVIQRPSVRFYGRAFMRAVNEMRLPKYAFGGEIGAASMVSRLRVPSIAPAAAGRSGTAPDVFDFGALGKVRVSKTSHTAKDVAAVLKRAALGWGNR